MIGGAARQVPTHARALDQEGDVPDVDVPIKGRHVLIVVRGYHYREDLAMLRSYIASTMTMMPIATPTGRIDAAWRSVVDVDVGIHLAGGRWIAEHGLGEPS